MRRRMRAQALRVRRDAAATRPLRAHFPRTEEIAALQDLLALPPLGPIVLTGPEGAGTSMVAKAALAGSRAPLLLHVNLRERAASGDRSLFWHFVRSSNYWVLPRELSDAFRDMVVKT